MARRTGTIWSRTYPEAPIRDKSGIRFAWTLQHLLGRGLSDYRADGRRGTFSPALVQLFDIYQGRHVSGSTVKFYDPGYFPNMPVIAVSADGKEKKYAAEYTRRMDSDGREKLLGSPLATRHTRRTHIKDMSQLAGEGVWELQLPLDMSDEERTSDIFNSFGILFDTDYSKPWCIAAY